MVRGSISLNINHLLGTNNRGRLPTSSPASGNLVCHGWKQGVQFNSPMTFIAYYVFSKYNETSET